MSEFDFDGFYDGVDTLDDGMDQELVAERVREQVRVRPDP
jgi:hypothetical protein